MKELRRTVTNSSFNVAGRISLALTILGGLGFLGWYINNAITKDPPGIILSAILGVFIIGMACILIVVAFFLLALYATFVAWVIVGDDATSVLGTFMSPWPKRVGEFIIKFIYGDWNRLDLFRRAK